MKELPLSIRATALLSNAFNFALLSLGLHPKYPLNSSEREKAMMTSIDAMSSFSAEVWGEVFNAMKSAESILQEAPELRVTNSKGEEMDEEDTALEGYVPGTGPFNAIPRDWEKLSLEDRDSFEEYYRVHGFYHEHDPRAQN